MSRSITIFTISLLLVSMAIAGGKFKVPLTKTYAKDQKIANEAGQFILNPDYINLEGISQKQEIDADITNQQDLLYFGNLWFFQSSPMAQLQFIFDTGSSWLWANVEGCQGCPSEENLPASQIINCGAAKSLSYGSGSINGNICHTSVSASDESEDAAKDMKMIAVNSATLNGISNTPWDGILGLLPTTSSGSDLFVNKMKEQGIIDEAVFGVHYDDSKYGSEITFGGFDEEKVPSLESFTFTELYDHNYWSVGLRSIKYGDIEIGGEAERGIIDTGSSLLLLPKADFGRWFASVSAGKTCGDYNGYKGCYCDDTGIDSFETMYILFDNYEYQVRPQEYVEQITTGGRQFCYFLIGELGHFSIPSAVLGDSFIRNYYIYHDMDNKRIGLYGEHMVYYETEESNMMLIGIIVVVIAVIIAGVGLYLCTRSSGKEDSSSRANGLLESDEGDIELKDKSGSSD